LPLLAFGVSLAHLPDGATGDSQFAGDLSRIDTLVNDQFGDGGVARRSSGSELIVEALLGAAELRLCGSGPGALSIGWGPAWHVYRCS
jgi:hypothetical protein